MKKNLKKFELDPENFFDQLELYFNSLENVSLYISKEVSFEHNFFGWDLFLSLEKNRVKAVLAQPKYRYAPEFKNYIRFTENLGILKIRLMEKGTLHSFDRECHQRLPESSLIRSYFSNLFNCSQQGGKLGQYKIEGLIKLLCSTFAELVFEAPHLDSYMSDSRRQMMIKINSSIDTRMGTSFSAQDLVGDLDYSVQYLNKVSREFRGLSLNKYINFVRLENLRRKLIYSNLKVADLAVSNGFPDVNYFIQLFKKYYSLTPHQLRKKMKASSSPERVKLHQTSGFRLLKKIERPLQVQQLSVKDKRCTLIFANLSEELLEVYWLSPEGEQVPMRIVDKLDRIHIGSAEGHCWYLKRAEQSAYFRVDLENCLICM